MTDATQPFSLTMTQQRAGTNGFNTPEAHSEFIDDAHDAGSARFMAAVVRVPGSTKGYFVDWDIGHGARDIRVLYGIGPNVCRKSGAGMRGLKNYGHIAAIGYFNPDRVTHISRAVGAARAGTLVFDLGALYAAVDAAGPAVNYRGADTTVLPGLLRHNPDCGLTDETRELVQAVLTAAAPVETLAPLREHLERILCNEVPSFMTTIMEYDSLPVTKVSELVDAHRAFRMDYYLALTAGGHRIELLSDRAEECISATSENAINPMGPADWPRITGSIETRTAAAVTCVKITVAHAGETAVFWMPHVNDLSRTFYDGRATTGPGLVATEPGGWAAATPVGVGIDFEFSVLSKAEEDRQKALVGSSIYKSVESMRGIRLRYHDRDLGVPVYNQANWTERRNVGGLRGTMTFRDPETAERLIGIKTKKHSANFEGLHPALQTVLNWMVERIIVAKYSSYKVCRSVDGRGTSPGVTDWKFSWFRALMLNVRARDPALVAAAPALSVSSVSGDSDSGSDDESASVSTASSSAVGGAGAAAPAPVVMTPVVASMRAAPMSLREMAVRLNEDVARLFNSNLDEVAENAPTGAFAGLPTLYSDFKKMLAILETSAGLRL